MDAIRSPCDSIIIIIIICIHFAAAAVETRSIISAFAPSATRVYQTYVQTVTCKYDIIIIQRDCIIYCTNHADRLAYLFIIIIILIFFFYFSVWCRRAPRPKRVRIYYIIICVYATYGRTHLHFNNRIIIFSFSDHHQSFGY